MIQFSRSTGDHLMVAGDGTFEMRRLSGTRVGRFGGALSGPVAEALSASADEARGSERPPRTEPWSSGATTESLTVEGSVVAELDRHEDPKEAGPWAAVVERCRGLLDELVDAPVAALELQLSSDPLAGRLRHIGSALLDVDLSSAAVEAHLVGTDGSTLGSWSSALAGSTEAGDAVEPGWEVDLGLEAAGFELGEGRSCEVRVSLALPDPLPYPASLWDSIS